MEFTTERALPPVTAWTEYWIALQEQYRTEQAWLAAAPDTALCFAHLDACKATKTAWERILSESTQRQAMDAKKEGAA